MPLHGGEDQEKTGAPKHLDADRDRRIRLVATMHRAGDRGQFLDTEPGILSS
jgi:hypothetical protein